VYGVAAASPDRQKKVLIAAERERPDVAEKREELQREQPLRNADRIVFSDETWAKTNKTRP
jgi:putative transposase